MQNFKAWTGRINIYLNERYFPLPYLIASIITALALWAVVGGSIGFPNIISTNVILVGFNLYVFPLVMRICDEYKDIEADRKHFPERALPRGAVSIADIAKLGIGLFVLFVILNAYVLISQGRSFAIFVALVVYLWLFLKYFYFPRFVSGSLMAALFLSNPLVLILSAYNTSLLFPEAGLLSKPFILICLLFWIPSWVWEICRKIRRPEEETAYDTYSKVLGMKAANLLPLLGIALMVGILTTLAENRVYVQIAAAAVLVCYLVYSQAFSFSKLMKTSKNIRPVTEFFLMLISLIELSFFLMGNT